MTAELLTGYRRVRSHDLDEAREQVGEVFCPHVLDAVGPWPGPRHRGVRFNSANLGTVGLSYLSYGAAIRIRRSRLEPFVVVLIPLAGRAVVRTAAEEVASSTRVAALPDPDAELDMHWEQDTDQLVVQLDRSALETQLRRLLGRPPEKRLRLATAMDLTSPGIRSWLATVHLLRADLDGPRGLCHPALRAQAEQLVMTQLLTAHPHTASDALSAGPRALSPRVIRRAEQVIVERAREALTVEDIAAAVGISVRSLQEGFRRYLDTTPTARLREVRLVGIRAELATADPARATVSSVAAAWGFWHLGRFARLYRDRWGELPSDTLRI
jgi:AraC-like DNA-binding protein